MSGCFEARLAGNFLVPIVPHFGDRLSDANPEMHNRGAVLLDAFGVRLGSDAPMHCTEIETDRKGARITEQIKTAPHTCSHSQA